MPPALRSDLAANWFTANPVLGYNEAGVESDTGRVKVGDGTSAWTQLPNTTLTAGDALKLYPPSPDPAASGQSATVTAGAQAVSAQPAAGAADAAGSVTATALAAGMAAGPVCTVTFSVPFNAAPRSIVLSETSAATVGLYVSARTAAGFTVSSRSAATASQVLAFDYAVTG